MLYDSIIPCFGSRFTVVMMPQARRYRVFPLGTFHYFDWRKADDVGVSIGTCPQIVSGETARIGVSLAGASRILPFAEGRVFASMRQRITPLTTIIEARDPDLPLATTFTFRSAFYPQSFAFSCAPGYTLEIEVTNTSAAPIEADVFFGPALTAAETTADGLHSRQPIVFPRGIDHDGIDHLSFEQIVAGDGATAHDGATLTRTLLLAPYASGRVRFHHVGYVSQPTLNRRGELLRFGYTTLWNSAREVLAFWQREGEHLARKGALFEATVLDATVPPELKMLLAASFKGLASNCWWAEGDWFSVMEIGAYHATLDVDYQLAIFFLQYWPELVTRMLDQWAAYYRPGSGYMAHDLGQHLEATGNRYGGPDSAMKVEENCNYLTLLHQCWRSSGDAGVLAGKLPLVRELVAFLVAADTSGNGLPNDYADNTNDWGSGLITASEDQSYHGVRLVAAYGAAADIAAHLGAAALRERCRRQIRVIAETLAAGWLGDHYPISLADPASYHHYSMWTTHGLLYPLRTGASLELDLDRLRIDLVQSTQRTKREHGCVHSTADVRGWLTQNLWRDCVAAYLGIDPSDHLRRYLGHGEYVSYEDTTILEVANELMVVAGATAEHGYAGESHPAPMVDGHPRPACGFGLLYALAGLQYDAVSERMTFAPVVFPLRIALTHLADWERERVPWVAFTRSIPNRDAGFRAPKIAYQIEDAELVDGVRVALRSP